MSDEIVKKVQAVLDMYKIGVRKFRINGEIMNIARVELAIMAAAHDGNVIPHQEPKRRIKINGYEFNAPESELLEDGENYFSWNPYKQCSWEQTWGTNRQVDLADLRMNNVFLDAESCETAQKAIDSLFKQGD